MFPGLGKYCRWCTEPAQHLTTASWGLHDLHDLDRGSVRHVEHFLFFPRPETPTRVIARRDSPTVSHAGTFGSPSVSRTREDARTRSTTTWEGHRKRGKGKGREGKGRRGNERRGGERRLKKKKSQSQEDKREGTPRKRK